MAPGIILPRVNEMNDLIGLFSTSDFQHMKRCGFCCSHTVTGCWTKTLLSLAYSQGSSLHNAGIKLQDGGLFWFLSLDCLMRSKPHCSKHHAPWGAASPRHLRERKEGNYFTCNGFIGNPERKPKPCEPTSAQLPPAPPFHQRSSLATLLRPWPGVLMPQALSGQIYTEQSILAGFRNKLFPEVFFFSLNSGLQDTSRGFLSTHMDVSPGSSVHHMCDVLL